MNIRKGSSIGPRSVPKREIGDLDIMIHGSLPDCRAASFRASREDLIHAHRHCERNPMGNKIRRKIIATGLRKRQANDDAERQMERRAS